MTSATLRVARDIPVPTSVSAEAQAKIAAGHVAVSERLAEPLSYPALDDSAGWKAHIAERDQALALRFAGWADAIDADVEQVDIAGVDVYRIVPARAERRDNALIFIEFHGGAFISGAGALCRTAGVAAAAIVRLETWAVDYRMPPDHPYPAALDDCYAVYQAALDMTAPHQVVVGGRSAGGNLAAALMLKARAEGLPMPACLVLQTPEVDLTESGDSFETNQYVDFKLPTRLSEANALYANGHDMRDPLLSPLFGDLSGFPPTFLQSGTRDLFLSNTVRMHRALRAAGVDAELHVWEAMPHGGFDGTPEDRELALEVRAFLAKHL